MCLVRYCGAPISHRVNDAIHIIIPHSIGAIVPGQALALTLYSQVLRMTVYSLATYSWAEFANQVTGGCGGSISLWFANTSRRTCKAYIKHGSISRFPTSTSLSLCCVEVPQSPTRRNTRDKCGHCLRSYTTSHTLVPQPPKHRHWVNKHAFSCVCVLTTPHVGL